jgi:hypothetical protein
MELTRQVQRYLWVVFLLNKGNSYTDLTTYGSSSDVKGRLVYSANPTVGTGHAFSGLLGSSYSSVSFLAVNGAAITSPLDQATGINPGGALSSIQAGSITPTEDGEIIVAFLGLGAVRTVSIDGGFTIIEQVDHLSDQHMGLAMAYKIQTSASGVNPTWSWGGGVCHAAASIASFKAAAVSGVYVYATGALQFYGSQFMQAASTGVVGGLIDSSSSIRFTAPTLALNVNSPIAVVSNSAVDTGIPVTLIGRNSVGALQTEAVNLNGTTVATGLLSFAHLLRAYTPLHTGIITISKSSNGSGLITLPSGATGINRPFFKVQQDQPSYEKIFLKNTQRTAQLNPFIMETSNPSGSFAFAIESGKNGGHTIGHFSEPPTGCTAFNNSSKYVPGGYLASGEAIGVWLRASGQYVTAPYGLVAYGSIAVSG